MQVTATAMLPYDDANLARSVLRIRLHHLIEDKQIPPADLDGATMLLAGPSRITDAAGNRWFQWVATLRTSAATRRSAPSDDRDAGSTVTGQGLLRRRAG